MTLRRSGGGEYLLVSIPMSWGYFICLKVLNLILSLYFFEAGLAMLSKVTTYQLQA